MRRPLPKSPLLLKALIAIVALAALAGFAGSQLAPSVPLNVVLLYSLVGAILVFVGLSVATVATLSVMQYILRKGGTDPQWFWLASEPPGLVALRKQAEHAPRKKN